MVCAGLATTVAQAADPQPYRVQWVSSGRDSVDSTLKLTSQLQALRGTAPVGPYGLIARARAVLAAFRFETTRAGAAQEVEPLVEELRRRSPEFAAMWQDNEVHGGAYGEVVKEIRHPVLGTFSFEYSAFAVDGRTDLMLVVYNPANPQDAERIAAHIRGLPNA